MNHDTLFTRGLVGTSPNFMLAADDTPVITFRLAAAHTGDEDCPSNWYTVVARGTLAVNLRDSIEKGHRVIVFGRLRIRDWESGERAGVSVEIEAEHVSHDLNFGRAEFHHNRRVGGVHIHQTQED